MKRGFTFLEMLVVIGVFGMVMTAIIDSVLFFYRANTSSIEQAYQVESARRGANILVRDLREATYADDGAYPLDTMGTSSLTFFADTDHDASIEEIHYELVGLSLYRSVLDSSGTPPQYTGAAATSTVSDHVRNITDGVPVFRYYDVNGVEIVSASQIAKVRSATVNLVIDITPKHAPGEYTLQSSATLRNLR